MIVEILNTSISEEEVLYKPLPTPPVKKPLPVPKKAAPTQPQTDVVAQTTDQLRQLTLNGQYLLPAPEKSLKEIREEKLAELERLISSDAPIQQTPPKKKSFFSKKEKTQPLAYGEVYTQGQKVKVNGEKGIVLFMS
jgi:hypothetical protein